MGSGCSSPLRRFGRKRESSSSSYRDDDPYGMNNNDDYVDKKKSTIKISHSTDENNQPKPTKPTTANLITHQEVNEVNDDPSTGSHDADIKVNNESQSNQQPIPNTGDSSSTPTMTPIHPSIGINGAITLSARMKGLNGTFVPIDRHLLVSPALSPAPSSTCYSPPPATSAFGHVASLDLNELVEAFEFLTFGNPNDKMKNAIKQQSELKHYTQHLLQNEIDLINTISVIFISADSFANYHDDKDDTTKTITNQELSILSKQIEANLKSFCDEHIYSLRFLNLSQAHLKHHFHINNLLDTALRIIEKEYQSNNQGIVVIAISGLNNNINGNDNNLNLNNKQLPSKIEAHLMTKLNNSKLFNEDEATRNLFKLWYEQTDSEFYLKPIYSNNPDILSDSILDRDKAWQSWLKDCNTMMKSLNDVISSSDDPAITKLSVRGHFDTLVDFLVKETNIQKRTLLIKGSVNGSSTGGLVNQPLLNINELARLLPDPNKMMLKRPMNNDEFIKTTVGWIQDNFAKFFYNISENQMSHGKFIPPFIEKNLFQELTSQRINLQRHVDRAADILIAKSHSFYLSQILPILNTIAFEANNNPCTSSTSDSKSDFQAISSNHLVFISGPQGCGKTTFLTQMIKLAAKDFHDRAHIIYRYCGTSLDSLSCNRLLRSICEQFCQIQGENTTAASYVYSNRQAIMNALNKVIKTQPTIIFLDGLDVFSSNHATDINWLGEFDPNSSLKVIITIETGSKLHKKILESYCDASYITIDNPCVNEWTQVLCSSVQSDTLNSSTVLEHIRRISITNQSPYNKPNYSDLSEILNITQIRLINNEPNPKGFLNDDTPLNRIDTIGKILFKLAYLITPYQLGSLIIALHSSRNGLFEFDLINIMTMISQSAKVYANTEYRFSVSLWDYIKEQMKPWLFTIICDKLVKYRIQNEFARVAIEYYILKKYPTMLDETRDVLFDYFNRNNSARPSKFNLLKSDNDKSELRANTKHIVSMNLANQASEIANYFVLTNKSKAVEHLINKNQFFSQFIYGFMPEEFIEDCDRLRDVEGRKSSSNDDLQTLVSFIKQSIYPLRYDGHQIYSQIYCRGYELIKTGKSIRSKKINDILNLTINPPVTSLLPISEISINSFIKTRIGLQHTDKSNTNNAQINDNNTHQNITSKVQVKQKIFTIKDDHRHVVVIYPEKGSLSVWDIYEEVAVRTISNIDHPRDLRMIDKQKAVILCNRELRVYDLDTGDMLTKLKGVMNQKMPFFEVFGDNYAIALARNRMYVNLLNLNTGELETTFKVGEDRFLNSLLVSADGGICVCGDETQKPFPLLVWNLNERRLMYDLRLDRHEFLTKFSAISDDGQIVVSACRQIGASDNSSSSPGDYASLKTTPNFIVIYDLSSGTLFKKWKPGLDTCAIAVAYLPNKSGKVVINAIVDSNILVWDLVTGSKKYTLTGHSAPPDVIKVQNNKLFSMDSTSRDQSLRIWDLDEGCCIGVFSPDAPISCCQMSIRGDALVCGFASEVRLSTLVMCKNESVSDVVKRNKRRKSSKSIYIFDEPSIRKSSH